MIQLGHVRVDAQSRRAKLSQQSGIPSSWLEAQVVADRQGSRITSDGGLILVRELDERLGFGELIAQHLTDSRRGQNTQLPLAGLVAPVRLQSNSGLEYTGCRPGSKRKFWLKL